MSVRVDVTNGCAANASAAEAVAPRAECVPLASLLAEGHAWDDLAGRALDPHPYYTRPVMEAHLAGGLAPDGLSVLVVRRGGRLEAVLPFRTTHDLCGLGAPVAQPFLSPFVTTTAPLVGDPAILPTLVDGLRMAAQGRPWRWPLLALDTAPGAALLAAMVAKGWAWGEVGRFCRPVCERYADHAAFLDHHPHRSRLKDLRRRQRRLGEGGAVTFTSLTEAAPLAEAVEAFLVLERAGWKGRARTAMACTPAGATFARRLFGRADGPVRGRADILARDGRPLAISLALETGGTAFLLKTAHDEAERAQAPGLVLEAEIVRALHETGFASRLDSATLGGSALESLYREQVTIAEIVAAPDAGRGLVGLGRRIRLARFENHARREAKRLLGKR